MNIIYTGRQNEFPPQYREKLEAKLQKISKMIERKGEKEAHIIHRQERFLHDVSHELRTPVTIARGHLDLHRRQEGDSAELAVAVDELARIERMISRLLLLAEAGQPQFLAPVEIEADAFLEEVFVRWSEVAPRAWRLGDRPPDRQGWCRSHGPPPRLPAPNKRR